MTVICDRGGCINCATRQFRLVILPRFSDEKIQGFMSLVGCDAHATVGEAYKLVADLPMRKIVDDAFAARGQPAADWPRCYGEFIAFADVPEQHRRVA